jgi:UDP-N-acetylglucosamine 2-epimerase (non-hydrolysing)
MTQKKRRILSFVGTRPEVIKMAPVIRALNKFKGVQHFLCDTGQHRQMARPLLDWFQLAPDFSLDLMRPGQSLSDFASRALTEANQVIENVRPDIVVCQGDTTTAMIVALASFYQKVKIAHVEAGLRTGDRNSPWPEELNRRVIDLVSDFYFPPTAQAKRCLAEEGVASSRMWVTGNTAIDALFWTIGRANLDGLDMKSLPGRLQKLVLSGTTGRLPFAIVTTHRRESFGLGMRSIARAIAILAKTYPEKLWLFPVHLNPRVQEVMRRSLKGHSNVLLTKPLDYPIFSYLLSRCEFVLTDSGGLQEECPSLGTPVFIMRNNTERVECVQAGSARLVGTQSETIVKTVTAVLRRPQLYGKMSRIRHPFGDGKAGPRIAKVLAELRMR